MADKELKSLTFSGLPDRYVIGGFSSDAKEALLACFQHVAWTDEHGQDYYDALYEALYDTTWPITQTLTNCTSSNAATDVVKGGSFSATITASAGYVMTGATVSITMGGTDVTASVYSNGVISIPAVTGALVITISAAAKTVSSIAATFTQGENVIYTNDDLDTLKSYLVVTATYTDSSTATVPEADYTLSGELTAGTSTITITYSEKTTTFTVTVTQAILLLYNTVPKYTSGVEIMSLTQNTTRGVGLIDSGTYALNWDGGGSSGYYPVPVPSGATGIRMASSALDCACYEFEPHTNAGWHYTDISGWLLKSASTSHDYTFQGQNTTHIMLNFRQAGKTSGGTVTQANLDAVTWEWLYS